MVHWDCMWVRVCVYRLRIATARTLLDYYHIIYILLKVTEFKQQTPAVTELDRQGSKAALTAAYRHEKWNQYKPIKSYK